MLSYRDGFGSAIRRKESAFQAASASGGKFSGKLFAYSYTESRDSSLRLLTNQVAASKRIRNVRGKPVTNMA